MLFCQMKWTTNGFSISIPSREKNERKWNKCHLFTSNHKKRLSFFRRNFSQLYWSSLKAHNLKLHTRETTHTHTTFAHWTDRILCLWLFSFLLFFLGEFFSLFNHSILCERQIILPFWFEKLSWDRFCNVKPIDIFLSVSKPHSHIVNKLTDYSIETLNSREREEERLRLPEKKKQIWKYCTAKKCRIFAQKCDLCWRQKSVEKKNKTKKKRSEKMLFIENYACGSSKVNGRVVNRTICWAYKMLINMWANWNEKHRKTRMDSAVFGAAFIFTTKKTVFKRSQCGSFMKMKSENYREVNAFYHARTNTLKWEKRRRKRGEKRQHSHHFCGDDDWHTDEIHTCFRSVWKLENKTNSRNWYFK